LVQVLLSREVPYSTVVGSATPARDTVTLESSDTVPLESSGRDTARLTGLERCLLPRLPDQWCCNVRTIILVTQDKSSYADYKWCLKCTPLVASKVANVTFRTVHTSRQKLSVFLIL
jgi:hypothetical protein